MSGKSVYFLRLKWGKKDHIFKARNIGIGPISLEYYFNSKTFNNLLWLSLI